MNTFHRPPLWLLTLLIMFPQLVETIYSPALPGIATSYHVSSERAAQTLSVYFVAFAVGVAMWGWLSDCIGRRRAMMAGLLCYATGSLMAVVATDFSVLLLEHNKNQQHFIVPEKFGELHGNIFRHFVSSPEYKENFRKGPVICLSVSSKDTYRRTGNQHPVLGIEYQPDGESLTELYFAKMGLKVRYFMPENSVAPFAFFYTGDLLNDYSNLELIATISTMETFQKIYRPEIYNANSAAGLFYRPDLNQQDHSLTKIVYDREERSRLAIEQGRFTEEYFIKPYKHILEQWSDNYTL